MKMQTHFPRGNILPLAATTQLPFLTEDLRQQQFTNPVISQIHGALTQPKSTPLQ